MALIMPPTILLSRRKMPSVCKDIWHCIHQLPDPEKVVWMKERFLKPSRPLLFSAWLVVLECGRGSTCECSGRDASYASHSAGCTFVHPPFWCNIMCKYDFLHKSVMELVQYPDFLSYKAIVKASVSEIAKVHLIDVFLKS